MSDEQESGRRERQRRITHLLADADLYFTVSKTDAFGAAWTLHFDLPDGSKAQLAITADESFVTVSHVEDSKTTADLEKLLQLSGRLAFAKVCLHDGGELAVAAQVPLSHIDVDTLRVALGTVLSGIVEARKVSAG